MREWKTELEPLERHPELILLEPHLYCGMTMEINIKVLIHCADQTNTLKFINARIPSCYTKVCLMICLRFYKLLKDSIRRDLISYI